jgi:hypothetical protein
MQRAVRSGNGLSYFFGLVLMLWDMVHHGFSLCRRNVAMTLWRTIWSQEVIWPKMIIDTLLR